MRRIRWTYLGAVALVLLAAAFLARPAAAAQVLYDDFEDPSNLVDPDRWQVNESTIGDVTESVRLIDRILPALGGDPANAKLLIARRFVVRPGASKGLDRVGYNVVNPAGITGIQVDVNLGVCLVAGSGQVEAQVAAAGFKNAFVASGQGDQTGDIIGSLRIGCQTTNQAAITWVVVQCTNSDCTSSSQLGSGSFGTVAIAAKHTLHLQVVGFSFVFTADGLAPQTFTPGVAVTAPNVPFFQIGTRIDATTPASGGEFLVLASFNNVFVDQ
jgi:hypothetical protein